MVERGAVRVGGAPAANPSRLVSPGEPIAVEGPPPRFVSRGGLKLQAALDHFGVSLERRRVLDAGASTGGFTDCALQAGAASVVAVDVGRGQLHNRLLNHPRVEVHERTNLRHVGPGDLGAAPSVVVADLSFISLRYVAAELLSLAEPGADLLWLVKPQFEASKAEVDAGRGVITNPAIWSRVLGEVLGTVAGQGATIMGLMISPLRGADGNVEFVMHGRAGVPDPGAREAPEIADLVAAAVAEAAQP